MIAGSHGLGDKINSKRAQGNVLGRWTVLVYDGTGCMAVYDYQNGSNCKLTMDEFYWMYILP